MKLGLVYLSKNNSVPPLGLASLATYLDEKLPGKVQTTVISAAFDDPLDVVKNSGFDLVGISAMTVQYPTAVRLAREVKAWNKDLSVFIGGAHISTLPASLDAVFDLGILGEGEATLVDLIRRFLRDGGLSGESVRNISGLVLRDGSGSIVTTLPRSPIEPLDEIPIPDRRYFDPRYFRRANRNTWGEFGVETSLFTSRGCPYRCAFCSTAQIWKKVRFHSPQRVVEEVKYLVEDYGITHIQIWDDLFTINRPRLQEIAKLLKEEGLTSKVKFNCQPRADLVDDELCKILKDLGVRIVLFGFESGNDRVLQLLKGGMATVEQNKRALLTCRKHGLKVQGSVIFGSPTETLEEMRDTLEFLRFAMKNGAHRVWTFVLTPFPATKIWEIAKERGKVSEDMDWNILSLNDPERPLLLDETISIGDFKKIFMAGRRIVNRGKWNKVWDFVRSSPWETTRHFLKNPLGNLKLLFSKKGF